MSTRGCIIELKKDVCKVGYLHYGANFASKLIHYGMLGCTALEKTRCKKHGQAILFFHRNFSEGCAILVCDFHFPKNICKTVIVSISQK